VERAEVSVSSRQGSQESHRGGCGREISSLHELGGQ